MKRYSAEVQKGLKRAKKTLLLRDFMPKLIINTPVKMSWQERALNLLPLATFIVFMFWNPYETLKDFPIALRVIRVICLIALIFITFNLVKVVISELSKQRKYVKRLLESCLPSSRKQILSTFDLAGGRGLFTVDVFENEQIRWRLHCRQFVKLLRTPLTLKTEADVYMDDNGHPRCVIVDSDEHQLVFVVHQMEDLSEPPKTKETEEE